MHGAAIDENDTSRTKGLDADCTPGVQR